MSMSAPNRVIFNLLMQKAEDTSEEGKALPLGFTRFNARDAKNVFIQTYKNAKR